MISIIICARAENIAENLRNNIKESIGNTLYEIIVIDNSANHYSIFSAYNRGVSLSNYPFLLFMHDDIHYHTDNWGAILLDHFKEDHIGAIGIAGTPYLPWMPGGWWSTGIGYLYLLQSEKGSPEPVLKNYAPDFPVREAVALDGVWFCIRKSLFTTVRFDEDTYDGFHFYDLDITVQVYKAGFKLLCINDILIHHLSSGVLDEKWIRYLLIFQDKWKDALPVSCVRTSPKQASLIEYRVLNTFIGDQLRVLDKSGQKESHAYLFALKKLLRFRRSYLYIKTPYWVAKLIFKYLRSRVAGR